MEQRLVVILIFLVSLFGCSEEKEFISEKEYTRWVGDSKHNPSIDDLSFRTCYADDNIMQYFNVGQGPVYAREKPSLLRQFKEKYKPVLDENQNGLIRIRFVVNCQGQAGRFRIIQADNSFKETEFDKKIVMQLLEITKGIEEWVVLFDEDNQPIDYYYYLIFKIENGQISKIFP